MAQIVLSKIKNDIELGKARYRQHYEDATGHRWHPSLGYDHLGLRKFIAWVQDGSKGPIPCHFS